MSDKEDKMSGGRFNYVNDQAQSEIFGYMSKPTNVFEDLEISELIWDVFELIHEYDWYASGDTDEKNYINSKEAFKKKWFENRSSTDKEIIDKAISELRDELYKSFGSPK